ncbi:MAG TPA: hypothetical protein VLG12_00065 [Candidatus Saccharimonadales bacterium]|nr:hypothetical protein [Candidatus Saccharimonadales bacterium]
MRKKISIYALILFFAGFLLIIGWGCVQGLDPDFGWHLRMGQDILSKGVPQTDTYSYTMPSYPFVNHEWLTGVIIAFLYPFIGIVGVTIIFVLLAYTSLLIQFPWLLKRWAIVPLLLSLGSLYSYMGVRVQVISWVFFSFLLFVLLHKKVWNTLRFSLPFVFLLWVNLHAGFPLGLIVFLLVLIYKTWEKKKINIVDWSLFICSILVTFINPYTYRIWWEVWVTFFDPSIRWSIQEWLPAFFFVNYYLLLLLPLSIVLIFSTRRHFSLIELGLYLLLLCFGLSSTRNIPFFLLLAFPMTTRATAYFEKDIAKISFAPERFRKMYSLYFSLVIIVVIWQIVPPLFSHKTNFAADYYPNSAITYLQNHPSHGNIFAPYAWGGYLIWKLPQKKIFIDGRMTIWKQTGTTSESADALTESNAIISGKEKFSFAAQKYHIDAVLLMNTSLQEKKSITTVLSSFFHLNQEDLPYLLQQIKKMGMKEVYRDKTAVIYRRE